MKPPSQSIPPGTDLEAEAAGWVMRIDRGLTPPEQDDHLRWLAADPRHQREFARQRASWRRLDQLVHWRPEHSLQANPDLLAPAHRRRIFALPLALAAAAMVAWAILSGGPRRNAPAPASATAALEHTSPAPAQSAPVAAAYELRRLDDGSVVELKAGAAVDVAYTFALRSVRLLRGEAHFTVAHNPNRPFVVTAGDIGVRAVGTAFDVKLNGPEVAVLVTEGRVRIGSAARAAAAGPARPYLFLPAGNEAVFSSAPSAPAPRAVAVSPAQVDARLAWRPELLNFDDAPLSEIVARFNRHNRVQLQVADPATAATRLSVLSFQSTDVEGFVRLLGDYGIGAENSGDAIILHRAERR